MDVPTRSPCHGPRNSAAPTRKPEPHRAAMRLGAMLTPKSDSPTRPAPSVAAIGGRPIHAMLVPFPIACFTLTLAVDAAYWQTANLMWQRFAEWLLFAGLVTGGLAAIAGLIDTLAAKPLRASRLTWVHGTGNAVVLLLAVVNSLVHARDGWTGVVPWGLGLSIATFLVLLVTGWIGLGMVFRHGAGVTGHD